MGGFDSVRAWAGTIRRPQAGQDVMGVGTVIVEAFLVGLIALGGGWMLYRGLAGSGFVGGPQVVDHTASGRRLEVKE